MSDKAIGFFGPHEGMTDAQLATVERLLEELAPDAVHHRSTIGADAQFDALAAQAGIWREAHPSLAKRYHANLACDVIHETETPGEARNAVENVAHIFFIAAGEGIYPFMSRKPFLEILSDGQATRLPLSILWLTSERTPFENANTIAAEFQKPPQITDETARFFAATMKGRKEEWREILEATSPLYYARLLEAATLRSARTQEAMKRGIPLGKARGRSVHDPTQDRPELIATFRIALQMARHIREDSYKTVRRHKLIHNDLYESARGISSGPSENAIAKTTQWILREQYGIEWFTNEEMNP